MIERTLAEVAEITGAELSGADPAAVLTGPAVADSRAAEPGGLFVADGRGHEFAEDAVRRGAIAVLASRPLPGLPCLLAPPAPEHPVDASVVALGRLAADLVRGLPDCTVVAVTGSSGKTGTKDLLAQVLAHAGPTVAPEASLNNELGVPLTVTRADASTRFLVLEMGAKRIGNLAYLAGLVRPRVGVVLNVGLAHVGEFGGPERIARAKGELVEALPSAADGGLAVLNADDALVRAMASRTAARVVLVGTAEDAEVRASEVVLDDAGRVGFRLETERGAADVRLELVGRHHVGNALAVAAIGLHAGMDVDGVAAALSTAPRRARWRMEVTERSDGVTVVNDAYNANPDSTRAAMEALVALAGGGSGRDGVGTGGRRRTWAVLGEMLELGAASHDEHAKLGRLAVRLGVDRLLVVGEGARPVVEGARTEQVRTEEERTSFVPDFVPDADSALQLLRRELVPGDVVLVKSSRDAGLRFMGDRLVADTESAGTVGGPR